MDSSTIAIIVSAVGATLGIGLATLILPSLRDLRRDATDMRARMARPEGLFEGFARPRNAGRAATS